MDTPSTSADALKREIERLKGEINRHKTGEPALTLSNDQPRARVGPGNNKYINPSYVHPTRTTKTIPAKANRSWPSMAVPFSASGGSFVRKDLLPPGPMAPHPPTEPAFMRDKAGALRSSNRSYKSKMSRRGRGHGRGGMNMTLDNTRASYKSRRLAQQRKYLDKPCPRFTTTGSCNRGLTCMYQHDPSKIAICWNFLQGNCPHTAENCPLSHEPSPQRTPLCVHFANNGRCTRVNCPFPHVHVGSREGICRDFAVLGYCEKGLDCDKQHVRECPDFAEKGQCTKKGCKLPHVIRANRNRKAPSTSPTATTAVVSASTSSIVSDAAAVGTDGASSSRLTVEDGHLGDEFISLTFHESESEDTEDENDDEDADDNEEGGEPHSDDPDVEDYNSL